jgi:hypothetical protein
LRDWPGDAADDQPGASPLRHRQTVLITRSPWPSAVHVLHQDVEEVHL